MVLKPLTRLGAKAVSVSVHAFSLFFLGGRGKEKAPQRKKSVSLWNPLTCSLRQDIPSDTTRFILVGEDRMQLGNPCEAFRFWVGFKGKRETTQVFWVPRLRQTHIPRAKPVPAQLMPTL